jgi:AraC-like DNA-binding protein
MIDNKRLSVKELLYILNYNTTENFYNAFKKHTGYTPVEYRRMMKEEKAVG